MATAKQIAANRRNAQKSTGPTSAAGREKASQNRRTHGLCGKFKVLSCESQERFDEHLAAFREAEKPMDAVEDNLVLKMARHAWCAERALHMQDDSFEPEEVDDDEAEAGIKRMALDPVRLNLAMRYHSLHDRAYRRAAQDLADRRRQRHLAEIGSERKKQAEAEAQRKSERHTLAAKTANLRNQLLEVRLAKSYMAEMRKITPPQQPQERGFEFVQSTSAVD
jgi:hypothetical protein